MEKEKDGTKSTLASLISSWSSWRRLLRRPKRLIFCWSSHVTCASVPSPCGTNPPAQRRIRRAWIRRRTEQIAGRIEPREGMQGWGPRVWLPVRHSTCCIFDSPVVAPAGDQTFRSEGVVFRRGSELQSPRDLGEWSGAPALFFFDQTCLYFSLGKHTCRHTETATYVKDTETGVTTKLHERP